MSDFNKYHENIKKMKQNLDFISDLNRDIFKEIKDPINQKEYADILADTDRTIELMKKGDLTELHKLQSKYADTNN